jgi:hypothetical protein
MFARTPGQGGAGSTVYLGQLEPAHPRAGSSAMTRTASAASLLHAAVQDLHAGKRLLADRLPGLSAAAGPELATLLREEAAHATAAGERLLATGLDPAGPRNLWMTGVLDDAARDARSHQRGRLLDIALVGAIRKAKAAEMVSGDTALALARAVADDIMAAAVAANQAEDIAADQALRALLDRLA